MKIKDQISLAERLRIFIDQVDIYPVSCQRLARGRTDREWLDAVLAGGARIVQLRDKESSDRTLLAKARYFREKTRQAGALFLVNDRVDIALLSGADGVHLGQDDLPPGEVRRIAPEMIIGLSCNTEEQAGQIGEMARKSDCPISYYNIGPIYPTGTKEGLKKFLGPGAVKRFSACSNLPFTVMGGIKKGHVAELVAAGARRIAVVTAITAADDMAAATSELGRLIRAAAGEE
jgi:thiamine-phosphate pyrophosphorylase